MKLKSTRTAIVEVTTQEVETLLKKLVEKKSGKKVEHVTYDVNGSEPVWKFELAAEHDESNLDEQKPQA